MKRALILVGLSSIMLLNGCSIVMSESELPGHYEGSDGKMDVSVDLRKDHTYSEKLDLSWQKQENVDGQWSWNGSGVKLTLALIPEGYGRVARDDWGLSSEIRFGRTVLIDYGSDLELKKTK